MPTKHEQREYRRIDVSVMETRRAADGAMIVEGYATTFNQPYQLWTSQEYTVNEQVDRHAFDETTTKAACSPGSRTGRWS